MITLKLLYKCNTYLYILSRITLYLSTENRFYNAYNLPHFDCCCVIWGNCTHYPEEELVRLQKRAAQVILDCDVYTPSSTMGFLYLNWMPFPERVTYMKAIQMFKTIRGDAPEYLRSSFTFASDIRTRPFIVYFPVEYSKTSFRIITKYICIFRFIRLELICFIYS